jgi:hypothetical protein
MPSGRHHDGCNPIWRRLITATFLREKSGAFALSCLIRDHRDVDDPAHSVDVMGDVEQTGRPLGDNVAARRQLRAAGRPHG